MKQCVTQNEVSGLCTYLTDESWKGYSFLEYFLENSENRRG